MFSFLRDPLCLYIELFFHLSIQCSYFLLSYFIVLLIISSCSIFVFCVLFCVLYKLIWGWAPFFGLVFCLLILMWLNFYATSLFPLGVRFLRMSSFCCSLSYGYIHRCAYQSINSINYIYRECGLFRTHFPSSSNLIVSFGLHCVKCVFDILNISNACVRVIFFIDGVYHS